MATFLYALVVFILYESAYIGQRVVYGLGPIPTTFRQQRAWLSLLIIDLMISLFLLRIPVKYYLLTAPSEERRGRLQVQRQEQVGNRLHHLPAWLDRND
jgi:hypothetical protein